jgi:UDP-3-O-[3-hydroxymyristoyl] glucosamine N-acyltransferase
MQYTLGEIGKILSAKLEGDANFLIKGIGTVDGAKEGEIAFALDKKYLESALRSKASAVVVPLDAKIKKPEGKSLIRVKKPKLAFVKLLELFKEEKRLVGIHPSSIIAEDAQIGKDVFIGAGAVIESEARIGDKAIIHPQVYIGYGAEIGEETTIYPNVTIAQKVVIGKRVVIHSGAVIGSDGFGYFEVEGKHQKVPQNGTVIVEDEVEIGANVCIDRATVGATFIGEGTKIDNLVQIGHNVVIGERCIIVAQVGISGSVKLGEHVTIAGQAGVAEHLTIGANTIVAARSGVTKSFGPNLQLSGFPAKPHHQEKRIKAALPALPSLRKEVKKLKEKVEFLENAKNDKK